MTVQIIGIETFRDGGSIGFYVEGHGVRKHVWLDAPFKGEPQALL